MRGHSSPPSVWSRCIRCRSNHQTNVNCLFVITLSTVCHIRMQFALSVGQLPVVTLAWGVETKGTHTKKATKGVASHCAAIWASKPCGLVSVHINTSDRRLGKQAVWVDVGSYYHLSRWRKHRAGMQSSCKLPPPSPATSPLLPQEQRSDVICLAYKPTC